MVSNILYAGWELDRVIQNLAEADGEAGCTDAYSSDKKFVEAIRFALMLAKKSLACVNEAYAVLEEKGETKLIHDLCVGRRAGRIINRYCHVHKIETVREFADASVKELKGYWGCGEKTLREIADAVKDCGFTMRDYHEGK